MLAEEKIQVEISRQDHTNISADEKQQEANRLRNRRSRMSADENQQEADRLPNQLTNMSAD